MMQFKRGDLAALPAYAPRVAAAMRAAGVAFSPDGAPAGLAGPAEMSQRQRKCST